ncbi:MAG: hypothetical protein GQ527_08460, partial [Bacteroidales bacterium]|nr:hypothetical protein [Bacteroidales bacterium]
GSCGYGDISGSVFLGYNAGYYEYESNKLYIENSDSYSPLIGGDFDADYVDINGDLNVTGNIKIEGGTPGDGKVLTSDAMGNASWQISSTGVGSIDDLSDAKNDNSSLYLGSIAGADDGNNYNTSTGIMALNANVSGQSNAAFGNSALLSSVTGDNNAAFGSNSMELNVTGDRNTSIGSAALYNNSYGYNNTAIGFEAGFGSYGSNPIGNVFLGHKAGYYETGNDKLYIDNSDTYSPLIYGDFDLNKLRINGELSVNNDNIKVNSTNIETNVNIVANKPIEAHDDIILSDNKNITYENVRTGKLQLSGLDFQHGGIGDPYMTTANYGPGGFYFETQAEYLYFSLYAPIKLPQGVTITKMTIGFASTLGTTLNMKIMKKTPLDLMGNGDELLNVDYTFNTEELHTYSIDGLNNATIDNDYVYLIDFFGFMTKEDGAFNAMFSVLTVTLEYEYTELNY